jgi:glucose/mannose transport system substrate-binding protein
MPTTWDEFNATADKLKAAGITPLAGGQRQDQRFGGVVLGIGGGILEALVQLEKALTATQWSADRSASCAACRSVFFGPGRIWATMVMNGEAFQIMGD